VHDLRATFITLALATGRTEAWIADRTGHRSSQMINRYRRPARTVADLGLGWLAQMCDAVPELANWRPSGFQLAPKAPEATQEPAKTVAKTAACRSGGIGRRGGLQIRCATKRTAPAKNRPFRPGVAILGCPIGNEMKSPRRLLLAGAHHVK
jgi:hypothetical protein